MIRIFLLACLLGTAEPHADEHDHHDHEHGHDEHVDEVKLAPAAAAALRIDTATARPIATSITVPARLAYNGEAVAHVGAIAAGRVKSLDARIGDEVKAGAVLATVESVELGQAQSDYLQRRVAAEAAKPSAELARLAYDRAKALYDQTQGISLSDVQTRQRELNLAASESRNADAAAVAAGQRLRLLGMSDDAIRSLESSNTIAPVYAIRAPIDGRVTEREITLGELVGPDDDHVLIVSDLRTLWAIADVPDTSAGMLRQDSAVRLTFGDSAIDGEVAWIAPEINAATRSLAARVVVPNDAGGLRPGMFGRAEIIIGSGDAMLAVPASAVFTVEGGPAVFVPVEGEPGTFAKRAVTLGPAAGGFVAITGGLKPGEKFVAAGGFVLKAELGKAGAAHEH